MLNSVPGLRSLKAVTAMASSARVLDLSRLSARTAEEGDGPDLPMFLHPVLNRAIIVKHNVGPAEEERFAPRRLGATKIIFPFDAADLGLGGQYLFVDQQDFEASLSRQLHYGDISFDRDLQVLRLLDKLPTLDPFLIRGILSYEHIEVDRRYYRLSEVDKADMLAFVEREIHALIQLCFRGVEVDESKAKKLSERLLGDENSPELGLLRHALRMEEAEFAEAMFNWKGFLYYRWRAQELTPQLKSTLQAFSRIRARRFERDELSYVMRCKSLLQRMIVEMLDEVNQRLQRYDRAFAALTDVGDPDSFRTFLIQGSSLFRELGERIGRLEQAVTFWRAQFGDVRMGSIPPDDIIDGMRDILQALAISTLRETPKPDAAALAAAV